MSDIQYSTDALNVLSDFYGVDTLVYVEGDDDVIFWQAIFEKFASRSVRFESVGGDAALAKRIASRPLNALSSPRRNSQFLSELLNPI